MQVAACIQAPKEVEPLELSVFFRLVEVAAFSYGSAGKRPPFQWGCPGTIGGKQPFKCVLNLMTELKQVLGQNPGFIHPNFQGKATISEKIRYEPRLMPYPRFLAFFRSWLSSQGVNKDSSKKFVAYSLRCFLPSLPDIARAPLSVRQELGIGLKPLFQRNSQSQAPRAWQSAMHTIVSKQRLTPDSDCWLDFTRCRGRAKQS